jgi:tetratricopeptide (TPR) repeat protein
MNDASNHSILAPARMDAASSADLAEIAKAVRAELETPSHDRARLIANAGSRLLAMADDCLEPERIDALLETGQLAYFEGRSIDGLAMVKAAAGLAARAGNVALQRKALTYEAALHSDLGDLPTSIESTAGAIIQARNLGEVSGEATLWGNLGAMLSQIGDWRSGLRACERALELDPTSGSALVNAAEACLELGNIVKGLRYARKCIESTKSRTKLAQLAVRADAEAICGRILLEVEDVHRAAEHAAAAREAAARTEAERSLPPVMALEGMCAALNGDRVAGLRLLRKAQDIRTPDRTIDQHQRQALRWTARLYRMLGDDDAARKLLNEQAEMMTEATLDHLRTASELSGSSALPLVSELPIGPYSKSGSVYERFAAVATR